MICTAGVVLVCLHTQGKSSLRPPASVWSHPKQRYKYKHLVDNAPCICGAGRSVGGVSGLIGCSVYINVCVFIQGCLVLVRCSGTKRSIANQQSVCVLGGCGCVMSTCTPNHSMFLIAFLPAANHGYTHPFRVPHCKTPRCARH